MKKVSLLLCFSVALLQTAFGQSCPPNIDFETGDFSNWQCYIGETFTRDGHNVISLNPSAPTRGRHEIISAANTGLDFYGQFPMLCPFGSNYSVRLGNDDIGAQAEGLSYTFTVPTTVDTFTFTYFYAVVFEDPNHALIQQPRFFVTAYDVASGDIVSCASYDYVSNGAIPGFEVSTVKPGVLFKRWTPASLQFAGLSGRSVRLEFKTADCTPRGHFGYAYVDVAAACSNILATAPYCIETNSLILNAPYGFKNYTWYTHDYRQVIGSGQSLTLSPPPTTSGVFHVDVEPFPGFGCRDTFQAIVTPLPVPDTPAAAITEYAYCQFQVAPPLKATASPGNQLLWYTSATGGAGSTDPPVPSTINVGTFEFYVSQKVLFGCESFRRKITVTIHPTPVVSFNINAARQCQTGNDFIFKSTATNLSNGVFSWDFGDSQTLPNADTVANHSYANWGTFNVKLKVVNAGICASEQSMPVTIVPKPIASFNHPAVICEKQTSVSLTDVSTVPGGISTINKWWWDLEGTVVQVQHPSGFVPNAPGSIPVKFVVSTVEGCISDTNTTMLTVRYKPGASLRVGKLLCDNEIIQFTDVSAMPAAATGETISKWAWVIDNTLNSALQHPSMNLSAGEHDVKLVTETNYGCRNEVTNTFKIHPKPHIQLNISDSCVFRNIRYTASDITNTTAQWYWNLGGGLHKDGSLISRSYNAEGDRPLTLIGETMHGCKDTIIRPFRIYDNKSFAGRDTLVAMAQPVQLNAKGGADVKYTWTPSTGLNNSKIENPIATWDRDMIYTLEAITKEGCDARSQIYIKRYKGPDIYIPNAFSPNNDGVNDVFRVVPVGIKQFDFMAVYNRYGQLVFRTTDQYQGWDGTFRGQLVSTGTFVVVSQAVDYNGKVMVRKRPLVIVK